MEIVQATLAMMAACIVFAVLARTIRVPYAVILVIGGMAAALIPGLPAPHLDPDFALAFFLPPLLQVSAYRTDWRAFRQDLRPILALALGAVLFTTLCIAVAARWLLPDLPWAAAIALGAIVAPPDAVAAGAVLRKLRLPRRMVTVLEGESLINDASSLVVYRLAVAAFALGGVHPLEAAASFLVLAAGGVAIGYAVGRVTIWMIGRLHDSLLETCVGFLAGYAAYMLADAAGVSGVLGVVACGMVLGVRQHAVFSARTRQDGRAVWAFVEFVLNSLVFILIGLQLNAILGRLAGDDGWALARAALLLSAVLIVSRFVWVFGTDWLSRLADGLRDARDEASRPAAKAGPDPASGPGSRRRPQPSSRHVAVIAWAGMRGVVSLAAAIGLPEDFPQRDLIVFLAFTAILATLVLQGTSLEWVIRRLGIEEPALRGLPPQEAAARRVLSDAMLEELERRAGDPLEGAIAADLVSEYRDKAGVYHRVAAHGGAAAELQARLALRLAAVRAGRDRLLHHFREGEMDASLLSDLEGELDAEEIRLRRLLGGAG
ncbi:Na+/H+ antiporter [Roseomonas sp. NAR14]|uniref:Na+/H+ antiporter n=1 Tax=Roseomonas acroporae TaxID=2937791 RepID=A0A9X2BVF3_9PROT|nr:Na+/H+ antiporter [Roseomonas acroporae]MCK8783944.1 Na+/H+ antiporter [Roseomonas acroporae]